MKLRMRTTELRTWVIWTLGLLAATSNAACTYSPVKVRTLSLAEFKDEKGRPRDVDGVPFYFPKAEIQRFVLTKLKREDGTYTNRCERIPVEQQVVVPNYDQLYVIRQEDLWFAQGTFGVTLANGILVSVNSVRDPQVDELITATAGAVSTFAALAEEEVEAKPGETLPDCNDGKRSVGP